MEHRSDNAEMMMMGCQPKLLLPHTTPHKAQMPPLLCPMNELCDDNYYYKGCGFSHRDERRM